jgi:hypothetical protein
VVLCQAVPNHYSDDIITVEEHSTSLGSSGSSSSHGEHGDNEDAGTGLYVG